MQKKKSNFAPALGNFSIQYNLSCAGIALQIMQTCSDEDSQSCGGGDFPQPAWVILHFVKFGPNFDALSR